MRTLLEVYLDKVVVLFVTNWSVSAYVNVYFDFMRHEVAT